MNINTDAWRETMIDNLLHSIRFRSSDYFRPELRAPWGFSIDVRGTHATIRLKFAGPI